MEEKTFQPGKDFARQLDREDELAKFRQEFFIDDSDLIYVDGNSLGRLPRQVMERMKTVIEDEWGKELVRGWNEGWYESPTRVGDKIGKLVGAAPGQVVVSDSTSINLYKLIMAALALRPDRDLILSDVMNFPSDLYILQSCIRQAGNRHTLRLLPSRDGITPDLQGLDELQNKRLAVLTLSHVVFRSGYLYDMQTITDQAHQAGALVVWDLSHSVGAVPIELDRWGVDLAVGCTYKYLNGGPGSPAFLYVRKEIQDQVNSPIWGWFGQRSPFAFDLEYQPAPGILHFLVSSPPQLSILAMEAGLDLPLKAGMEAIRRKSVCMSSYAIDLFDRFLAPLGFSLGSPRQAERRGSHISIRHPEGYRINRTLIEEMKVLPDFRPPDNIRLGLSPLYNTFEEVWEGIDRIRKVVHEGRYLNYSGEKLPVT